MYSVKNLTIFLKYLFKSKWTFKLPKKNKFILVDGIYNPFLKYIKAKDFTVLHRRGEEINFSIFCSVEVIESPIFSSLNQVEMITKELRMS